MTRIGVALHAAVHGCAKSHGFRRIGETDLHLKSTGYWIGLRRHLAHPSGGRHLRIVGQANTDFGVRRSCTQDLRGDIEDRVAPLVAR